VISTTIGRHTFSAPGTSLLDHACQGLAERAPELSARRRQRPPRRLAWLTAAAAVLAVAGLTVLAPLAVGVTLMTVVTLAYAAALVHRIELVRRAVAHDATLEVTDEDARAVPDAALPIYTVLVPAYREPAIVAAVVRGLGQLDYPAHRLDIKLLLEADDKETIAAAERACAGTNVEIVLVPAAEPRTKPKACNYGLALSQGEFVTIYDAEDRPEPLQLRKAVVAFRRSSPRVACLQARLSYHNAEQNLLTRWFTCEYDTWFRWLLPGLVATGAPIPLGGTSNHIRRDVLVQVGAWDAFNVTEDADLGVRLARMGWRVAVLGSTTYEEANSDVINWVKQRSRWYKGYLQTCLVHARSPRRLVQELGWKSTAGFLLFIGGTPLLALLNPLFWALSVLWWLAHPALIERLFPAPLYHLGMACWVIGGFGLLYANLANTRASGKPQLAAAALTAPLYWALMSLAAVKAMVQLITQPSYWEKTTHGLDSAGVHEAVYPADPTVVLHSAGAGRDHTAAERVVGLP
jgi:cellulose synthase/poly-beta-1,6-N-acetylglucosamine synthase-like glycosyltransferase